MIFAKYAYMCLGCGLAIMFACSCIVQRICKGSKSTFAYTLLAFTMVDAIQDLATFFSLAFPQSIYYEGQKYEI